MNRKKILPAVLLFVAIVILVSWAAYEAGMGPGAEKVPSGAAHAFDRSISDGIFTVSYPSGNFGLATNTAQLTVHSYIPPCDEGFDYCLYYTGAAYDGTNFESAGIRIANRTDIASQSACLTTEPTGYSGLKPAMTTSSSGYAAAAFGNVGGAGAGHYAVGTLYRLAYDGRCYEFETRIGQTQFMNYPSGTIKQFTSADETSLRAEILDVLSTITLPGDISVRLPPSPAPQQ